MAVSLAQLVTEAKIHSLSLIGLSKNVGKTTTTNHLLETLVGEKYYRSDELALTSLGLDGETVDALTGLPKPRYVPQAGLLVATTAELLLQAESVGAQVERLVQLAGRTPLGPVIVARILHPGRVIIAGPTLLHDLRNAIHQLEKLGARLSIVDGAINRLGAAAPRQLEKLKGGEWITTAGLVTIRQQPQSAKGTVFLLMEDEFGFINVIVSKNLVEQYSEVVRFSTFVVVEGTFERDDGVRNVIGK